MMELEEDEYVEYVPVAKRRALEAKKTLLRHQRKGKPIRDTGSSCALGDETLDDDDDSPPSSSANKPPAAESKPPPSLLVQATQLKRKQPAITRAEQLVQQEIEIIQDLLSSGRKPLMSVSELAKGIAYTEPLPTGWKPPLRYRRMPSEDRDAIRKQWHIVVDGEEIPPPVSNFRDMKFPDPILEVLKVKGISRPTPIQLQGLPVVLSGRDMIGISSTGSGKTLVFVLPLIMIALQEEWMMPVGPGEGPLGLIVCPTRELARQTYDVVQQFLAPMAENVGYPELRCLLGIGGIDNRLELASVVKNKGVHIVVATPGRLKDMLAKKKMRLDICRFLTLDEADKLVDGDFEDVTRDIFDHLKGQRQTLLFSATMPTKVHEFARRALVKPVTVSVGRAGAANLDVIQEVEYVKQEAKIVYLLECLQKTPPPVVVFCENNAAVCKVHEYLLVKGVDAVSFYGKEMEQTDRDRAVALFKAGKKDVLVATDGASKGLDFPNIQHVINYDMPAEIENYVHRIGRTGRCGKTGLATTFINSQQSETTLLDLKHLLQEARQRIPPVLAELSDPVELGVVGTAANADGCAYCGGLGHRISSCPKLEQQRSQQLASLRSRDYFGSGGYRGEM